MKKIMTALIFGLLYPTLLAPGPALAQASGIIDFMIFGEPAEKEAYDELVAAFSKKNPQIKVNLVYIPSQSTFRNRLSANLAAGTPPDVFLYAYRRYTIFAA